MIKKYEIRRKIMKRFVWGLAMPIVFAISIPVFSGTPEEACQAEKDKVAELQSKQDAVRQEIKTLRDEVKALNEKKKEILKKTAEKKREKTSMNRGIKTAKVSQKKACAMIERCRKAEVQVKDLNSKVAQKRKDLKAVRKELKTKNKRTEEIVAEIEKLEKQYGELSCTELEAGKTEQATIDKCHDIFSRWNALKKELDQLKESMLALKGKHKKIKMRAHRGELKALARKIRANCKEGPQVKEVEELESDQEEYDEARGNIKEINAGLKKIIKVKLVKPNVDRKDKPQPKPEVKEQKPETKKQKKKEPKGKATGKISLKGKASVKATGKLKANAEAELKAKAKGKASLKIKK